MSTEDKISNKAQDLKGQAKEKIGEVTNNRDLEAKGKTDQAKAAVKDVGEQAKDAFGKVKDAVTRD